MKRLIPDYLYLHYNWQAYIVTQYAQKSVTAVEQLFVQQYDFTRL